tara:strand:+ start:254 stop:439 length:186 start_codon:yes stop_codon:yes gene_type:complete
MKKVAKKLETNVAELIILSLFLIIFLSSCGSSYVPCPAYGNVEAQEEYHASMECENCDEID